MTAADTRAQGRVDRWISVPEPRPQAPVRLFCLPYAGGGASVFRDWPAGLGDRAEVAAVQLPGRENRLPERSLPRMALVLDALEVALAGHHDHRPFALYGHSTGALIAFALAHRLAERGEPMPGKLFVGAAPAPSLRVPEPDWSTRSDQDLVAWLTEMGGTPQRVLDNPDLLGLLLPTIRADLCVGTSWVGPSGARLAVPIRGLAGQTDTHAGPARVRAWAYETDGPCAVSVLPGGHFFIHSALPEVLRIVDSDLREVAKGPR